MGSLGQDVCVRVQPPWAGVKHGEAVRVPQRIRVGGRKARLLKIIACALTIRTVCLCVVMT